MFDIGEYIIYGNNGVCQVKEYMQMENGDGERTYYVLVPLRMKGSVIYSPVDNKKVPMRKILTKQEADDLLEKAKEYEEMDITECRGQEQVYKDILQNCSVQDNLRFVKTMYQRKLKREMAGKKITAVDEKYLFLAKDSLLNELAIALGVEVDMVDQLLESKMRAS